MGQIKILVFLIFWAIAPTLLAQKCDATLAKVDSTEPNPFPPGHFADHVLKLEPKDFLPKEFIDELEKKGPITFDLQESKPGQYSFSIKHQDEQFMKVALIRSTDNSNEILINELRLENPLAKDSKENLGPDQRRKGLPATVFNFTKNRLFQFLEASGIKKAFTNSQQHFGVMMLYRKGVGLAPITPEANALVNELDSLYRFARKELPDELRPKEMEDFSAMLGIAHGNPKALSQQPRRLLLWQVLRLLNQQLPLPKGVEVLKDSNGKIRALRFEKIMNGECDILFLAETNGKFRAVIWSDIIKSKALVLGKVL